MKKSLLIIQLVLFAGLNSFAQDDSKQIELEKQVRLLKTEISTLKQNQQSSNGKISDLSNTISAQSRSIDSLCKDISKVNEQIKQTSSDMKKDISDTNDNINYKEKAMMSAINTKSVYAGLIGLLALVLSVVIFIRYRRRVNQSTLDLNNIDSQITSLKNEQHRLEENIIASNDKLISAIEKQAVVVKTEDEIKDQDHSLALAVANELTRIQQNLNFMDPTVKGVSQLKNRAKAIMTTLNSKQYDIPDLLGKVYNEGDNIIATMELNEDMKEGTNRIKRVIRPQVSYKGKLIQAAEVFVEFNE
jgi:predicted  nucleic acid-binding Zn-ribbon protein